MNFLTHKIFLRVDQYKNPGEGVIYLRATLNRIHRYVSLRIRVKEKNWNPSTLEVRLAEPNAIYKNQVINMFESKARNIRHDFLMKGKYLSLDEFIKQLSINYNSSCFYEFVENEMKQNKSLSKETLRGYDAQVSKLKTFKESLCFAEIDSTFLNRYEKYMVEKLHNKPNTVTRTFTFMKAVINKAKALGVTEIDPFKSRKLGFKEGTRNRLSIEELDLLTALFESGDLNERDENVLRYFLFSCFTGLRYGDVFNLKWNNIEDNVIALEMNKTSIKVRIPIIERARKLLPEEKIYLSNKKVFRVLTNQRTNSYLKDIMKIAGIKKDISFHCARHSFATNGIEIGIPLEVISQLLGHTDVKITRIYAKYSDSLKVRELNKWDQIDRSNEEKEKEA
ncbi:site-specific integrase [Macellibacteroides fermentans]|uniref:site-specific integrase n=1 Tax=Macellibacteroides fermentans TaxID=879969 RepID=UPI0033148E18